jgi:secreted PhoX family phosphatase
VPNNTSDLKLGGKMQVLQVASKAHSGAITWGTAVTDDNIKTQDMKDLHTYGLTFTTKWVTIHDTSVNGFAVFDANGLARAAGGTPFKRPENGQFRPWSGFSEFFFSETGDTNALPAAFDNKADVMARLDKLAADAKAAGAAIKDEASFKAEWPKVVSNCGGCHKEYRKPPAAK